MKTKASKAILNTNTIDFLIESSCVEAFKSKKMDLSAVFGNTVYSDWN
jgi:hypothetical protein